MAVDFDVIEVEVAVAIVAAGPLVGGSHKLLKKGRQWENATILFATCWGDLCVFDVEA